MDSEVRKSLEKCFAIMRWHKKQETVPVLTPNMKLIILNQDDGEFKEFLGWLKKVTGSFVLKQDYQEISLYVREKDLKRKEIPALQETLDKMISETAVS
jgi:hypothetical protein